MRGLSIVGIFAAGLLLLGAGFVAGAAWTELWEVSCSPVYACTIGGLPPLSYVQEGAWSPRFRPWPGESLTLAVARREAAEGQTLTVDGGMVM